VKSLELVISLTSTDERFHCTSISDAAGCVRNILESTDIQIEEMIHTNKGKHRDLIEKMTGIIHHVKFAREPFRAFGYYFPQFKGLQGESLNADILRKLPEDSVLWFALSDGLYNVRIGDFLSEDLTRTIRKNNYETTTYSYPLEKMGRLL